MKEVPELRINVYTKQNSVLVKIIFLLENLSLDISSVQCVLLDKYNIYITVLHMLT